MRFCPFCAQENPDDARECGHCGKRLPAARTAPRPPAPPPRVPPRPPQRTRPPSLAAPLSSLASKPVQSPADVEPPTTPMLATPPMRAGVDLVHSDAVTLTPETTPARLRDPRETREPKSTMLGIPAVDPHGPNNVDSQRRETKPISVTTAAQASSAAPRPPTPAPRSPTPRPPTPVPEKAQSPKATAPRGTPALPPTVQVNAKRKSGGQPILPTPERTLEESWSIDDVDVTRTEPTPFAETELPPAPFAPPRPIADPDPAEPITHDVAMPEDGSLSEDALLPQEATLSQEASLPRLDHSPTPILPTLAVPPMPPPPQGKNPLHAVAYLLPLGKAIWARAQAQKTIRALLHGDQKLLDTVLRELGRVVREENLEVPVLVDEMRRVKAEEERREQAESELHQLGEQGVAEQARWQDDEAARKAELTRLEAELHAAEDELKQKGEERRGHEAEHKRLDAQLRAAEKRAAQHDARAAKAEITPPEKGGGSNTAANERAAAEAARKEATALIPPRDVARAKAEALDAPLAALTKQVVDGRAGISQKRKELTEAAAAHKRALQQLAADRRRAEAERDGAEREMSQRFVAAGTLLNLNRVEHPRLSPLYDRIDELKGGVNAREAAIVRLESERRAYDRSAVQRGLGTLGGALGLLVLLGIVLVVVLARR